MTDAYPLAWPDGWPRTASSDLKDGNGAFKRQKDTGRGYIAGVPWTFAEARDALIDEAWKHMKSPPVLSSNFQTGRNGPMEGKRRPDDQAIAIYLLRKGKPYVMACDRYRDAEGNMRSLALALEALRTLERHGGGLMLERAFEGFTALTAGPRPWEILDVVPNASADEIRAAWRDKIKACHERGDDARLAEVNVARDTMLKALEA